MSSVSIIEIVVPFFGAAVLMSCGFTCCCIRRLRARQENLLDRIETLEARATAPIAPPPTPALPPSAPQHLTPHIPVYNIPLHTPQLAQYRASPYFPAVPMTPTVVATAPPANSMNL
jgi:hypothetical protein